MTSSQTSLTPTPDNKGEHMPPIAPNIIMWQAGGVPLHTDGDYTIRSSPLDARGGSVLFAGTGDMLLRVTTSDPSNVGVATVDAQRSLAEAPDKIRMGPRQLSLLCSIVRYRGEVAPNTNVMSGTWGEAVKPNTLISAIRHLRNRLGPLEDILQTNQNGHSVTISETANMLNVEDRSVDSAQDPPNTMIRLSIKETGNGVGQVGEQGRVPVSKNECTLLVALTTRPNSTMSINELMDLYESDGGLLKHQIVKMVSQLQAKFGKGIIIRSRSRGKPTSYQLNVTLIEI